ncbi:MAG: hypothetical protein NTY68_02395 [Candidatus Micrarchaeota archaeon]|nr:hypothetical protein [Candidatus Micrarchaeota archaeon]
MYIKNLNLIDKETENGLLLFDTDSGRMMELNITARLMWQKTGTSFRKEDLKRIIEEDCASIMNLDEDLSDFIKMALKSGLVTDDGKN